MRLNRFYQAAEMMVGSTLTLNKDVSGHVSRVLRLTVDEQIQLFNGDGNNYQAKLLSVGKAVSVEILDKSPANNESNLQIHLGQAISRGERMDFTLQKAVELGVHEITPLLSERVQFRLDAKRIQRKMQHWQKVIESACEQSGRATVPLLHVVTPLEQWLKASQSPGLLLVPEAKTTLMEIEQQPSLQLMVGPEGGFSAEEEKLAITTADFTATRLGPRILRTETAALSAISVLQARFGDL